MLGTVFTRLHLFAVFWATILNIPIIMMRKGRFLQYDAECPFLSEEEYAKRMVKGRCPVTSPTPPSPTAPMPKQKNISRLSRGTKRFLLKFISLGKKRMAEFTLDDRIPAQLTITEGAFLTMRCPRPEERKKTKNVTWYFEGQKIVENLFNWRVQLDSTAAQLQITPVLSKLDEGRFECFVDEMWRGSLTLTVETTMEAILAGYLNFLMGSFFSFLFTIGAFVYYWRRPEEPLLSFHKTPQAGEFSVVTEMKTLQEAKQKIGREVPKIANDQKSSKSKPSG